MNNKQVSLWLNGQFLNLYAHKTLPIESVLEMTKRSAQYFNGDASREDLKNARVRLMLGALVDQDDSEVVLSLSEPDVDLAYTLWVLGNG
jgi:hypothetical protein